jgi:hypothetical protein
MVFPYDMCLNLKPQWATRNSNQDLVAVIIIRVIIVAIGIIVFSSALIEVDSNFNSWFPCPDPNPPPGLTQQFYTTWSLLLFIICAIYILIPFGGFQFWASVLPISLLVVFSYAFTYGGAPSHALYLSIEGIFALFLGIVFKGIAEATISVAGASFIIRMIALLAAYFGSAVWAKVQAIGFVYEVC